MFKFQNRNTNLNLEEILNMSSITNRRKIASEGSDFYPTPAWGTRALLHYEKFDGTIVEPCCGNGSMSEVLKTTNHVVSTDLHDRGYGEIKDVFTYTEPMDNVVTNPPFLIAGDIILHMLPLFQNKMAMFLRTAFLESVSRYNTIYSVHPPARIYVFSKRITLYPAGQQGVLTSGTTSYAWFVWERENSKKTELCWIAPSIGQD